MIDVLQLRYDRKEGEKDSVAYEIGLGSVVACALMGIGTHCEEGNIQVECQTVQSGVVFVVKVHHVANVQDTAAQDVSQDGAPAHEVVGGDLLLLEAVMKDEDTGPRDGVCWSLPGVT